MFSVLITANPAGGATAMMSESESEEADMGRLQGQASSCQGNMHYFLSLAVTTGLNAYI
ncbi:hypothetical protein DPMN_136310 [Dreissena polymorpha]|uniref:Uncharacterized protein n=1 Tax=Dreissena polymorpha TaxID=45954 RepID=A0A9D4G5K3_DREPO|nr:hypothetical protein DPMN_136234 [Dreissena polymorpha]KAH3807962.1 hypothetical protein DPMN_136310 [Dreissena polymorpha]